MKGRRLFVEHRQEMAKGILVATLAGRHRATREVRGCEQRSRTGLPQRTLRLREHWLDVLAVQGRGKSRNKLAGDPELRLLGIARQRRRFGAVPYRLCPVAGMSGDPGVVDESLSEHAEPALLTQPVD